MKRPPSTRLVRLATMALVFTTACDPARPLDSNDATPLPSHSAAALSSYFPPSEAAGGWRKTADPAQIGALGIDANRLSALGSYLTTLPYEGYATGVSGYSASNKAAIVVKNGWIVGEYYNQPSAATAVYYLASNGKTFSIMLVGRMALDYPQYGFGLSSKLYDTRWLPQGFPLSDARKSAITFDLVFRHASGIVPEAEAAIASGAVRTEAGWEFVPFTVGKDAAFPVSAPLYYTPGNPAAYPKGSAYSSVAFNHFSLIFRTVTGLEPSLYLREGILDRIGVGRMAYKVTPGLGDYLWATAGNGLASARDFARIGYLMLHDGRWGSAQVLPDGWLSNFTTSPDYRNIRSNVDCRWGAKFPADMYRTTGSGLNWALMVPSLDMMLTFNGRTPKSLGAEVDTVSLQKLFAAVTERYVACDGTIVNDTPRANAPPVASFSSTCSGLVCSFTDASSDADGTVTAWQWTFGDGTSSTTRHPSHTYAAAGSYTVGLTVTDDGGAQGSAGRTLAPSALALGATGRKVKGLEYVDLVWSGAASASVDIYRNGAKLVTVPNTGRHTDATGKKGGRTFTYRVCEATTTICSNTVSVAF